MLRLGPTLQGLIHLSLFATAQSLVSYCHWTDENGDITAWLLQCSLWKYLSSLFVVAVSVMHTYINT